MFTSAESFFSAMLLFLLAEHVIAVRQGKGSCQRGIFCVMRILLISIQELLKQAQPSFV